MLRSAAPGPGRAGAGRHDHAPADFLGAGGVQFDVMDTAVHAVDDQPDALAHLVAAQPLVEHAADNALGRRLAVQDVARGMAVLRQSLAIQRPVHGLDDVAAFAEFPQGWLGPGRHDPAAGLDLCGESHALQLARPLDQQRAVLAERVEHVLIGAQVGEVLPPLLRDQHPVEPGEAVGVDLPLQAPCHLLLGLAAQLQGDDLAGPLANAVGDIVAGDVEGLAVLGDAAHQDMGVWVSGVVVIDRDPVELRPQVGFHLLHQIARGLARVGQLHPVLGRDDEAELMAILAAPVEEGAAVLHVALAGIDLALLAVAGHAVAFEVTQVRVHRLGADELPPARCSALRIELYHASLHRHAACPGARTARVPAPGAPILERHRRRSAPTARIEPAASLLSGLTQPTRVAACAPDRLMDLADKTGRASAHPTDPARGSKPAATVADLAGTDAEVVFVASHEATIGSRSTARKSKNAVVVE